MLFIYNILVTLAWHLLKIIALFNPKINLFVNGRKNVFSILETKIKPTDKTIWFHAASLGEYEQGLPLIEKIKELYADHKIVVTFFSPSGYEVKKNNTISDTTVYLPLDTKKNARTFIQIVNPQMVFFIKYEFWPNYLNELKNRNIPTYLVSGIFSPHQAFFKWYGEFYRKALDAFTFFFVQNESSKEMLLLLNKKNCIISGDTRFDRVAAILNNDNTLHYISEFKNNTTTIVAGSTWSKDEDLLLDFINTTKEDIKLIIAPHNIVSKRIQEFKNKCNKKVVLLSEKEGKKLADYDVFIIDTIGILTKIYSYASIAYVGGGFGKSGIHNILEPATFGVPVIIGPIYNRFSEAIDLVKLKGCFSISNKKELELVFEKLIKNPKERELCGEICRKYIQNKKGAINLIVEEISLSKE